MVATVGAIVVEQRRPRARAAGRRKAGAVEGNAIAGVISLSTAARIRTRGPAGLERDVSSRRRRQEIHAMVVEGIGRLMESAVRRLE